MLRRSLLTFGFSFALISFSFADEHTQSSPPVVGTTTGNYVVYRDGKRDHRAELRLMQQSMQYQKPGYGAYAVESFKRNFDYRAKRKIDAEVNRALNKVFN